MKITFENLYTFKHDLYVLFGLKLISFSFIYYILYNLVSENPLDYPDLGLYSICDQTKTNALYTQILCLVNANNSNGMFNLYLITFSCILNLIIAGSYYVLLAQSLSRIGQKCYLLGLGMHPYLAVYFPKFYTDLFGSLGILLLTFFILRDLKINNIFLIVSVLIINLRSALIPPFFLFALNSFLQNFVTKNIFLLRPLILLFLILTTYWVYSDFSISFLSVNNFYNNKLLNPVFLLGFRESVANLGFSSLYTKGVIFGNIQLIVSFCLLFFHVVGLIGLVIFSLMKNKNLLILFSILIIPLIGISHLRYLLPMMPLIIFGFAWLFFRNNQ